MNKLRFEVTKRPGFVQSSGHRCNMLSSINIDCKKLYGTHVKADLEGDPSSSKSSHHASCTLNAIDDRLLLVVDPSDLNVSYDDFDQSLTINCAGYA